MAGNTIVVRVLGNTKGLTRSLKKARDQIQGLEGISRNLGGAFKYAAIGAAGLGAASVGAGAVGAAALAAMPAAVLGIGVAFAATNKKVKKAFEGLKTYVVKFMEKAVAPIVPVLVDGARQIKKAFDTIGPAIKTVMKEAAPLLKDVFGALGPLAKELGPLLVNAFRAGAPVLKAFIEGLIPLFKGLSGFFEALGTSSGDFAGFMTALMQGVGNLLPPIGRLLAALTPLGTAILTHLLGALETAIDFITKEVVPRLERMYGFVSKNKDAFLLLAGALGAVWAAIKGATLITALTTAFTLLGTPVGIVLLAILAIAGAFVYLWQNSETFRTVVTKGWEAIKTKITEVIDNVWPRITAAFDSLKAWWDTNGQAVIDKIGAVFDYIKTTAMPVVEQLVSTFTTGLEAIRVAIDFLVGFLMTVWNKIAPVVVPILKGLWEGILGIIRGALEIIQGVFNVFIGIFTGNWSKAWTGIKQIFSGIWTAIKGIVQTAWNVMKAAWTVFTAVLSTVWEKAWNAIKAFVGSIWDGIKRGVSAGIDAVVGFMKGLKDKVLGALSGAGSWLVQTGKNLLQGLIDGVKAMAGRLVDSVKGAVSDAIDGAKRLLGIASPSKVFKKMGKQVGQGLVLGLESMGGKVTRAAGGLTAAVANGFSAPTLALDANAGMAGAGGANITFNINVPPTADKASIGREIQSALDEWQRVNG